MTRRPANPVRIASQCPGVIRLSRTSADKSEDEQGAMQKAAPASARPISGRPGEIARYKKR